MHVEPLSQSSLEEDSKRYIKGVRLAKKVSIDYETAKHVSFSVEAEETKHNVMYFDEKPSTKKWQCDCKWYTLQNKVCSHMIAVNLALKEALIKI